MGPPHRPMKWHVSIPPSELWLDLGTFTPVLCCYLNFKEPWSVNCQCRLFEKIKNRRTASAGYLKNQKSKNCQCRLFEKIKNQRTANAGYFKTIEELAVFIKEPVKNQWFYSPVLVYNWAFDFFIKPQLLITRTVLITLGV